jgi:L-threonylcarbamoyladenylate synthase
MNTEILPVSAALARALDLLRAGEAVAFPTDTVYGVGTLARDAAAVERLYVIKERALEKAIPILLADAADLSLVSLGENEMARRLAAAFWPGALTLIVPKHPAVPETVSPFATVGVRVPNHEFTRALIRAAGPLAVTSANLSGQASPRNAAEVAAQLAGRLPLIVDGGDAPGGLPSTVVDVTGDAPKILREGPISLEQVLAAL